MPSQAAWLPGGLFGENSAVVSAIASHTTGKENMNLLETIIYVADYMEPNRAFPRGGELAQPGLLGHPGGIEAGPGDEPLPT